ncbi:glycosyltransferase family 1 protein [Acinetobacter sp. ANC 4633]|uniref:glycosyltransferase family 4 protein n=1 Tax=Acinetobacter sp. ANC 4633 TaxID=2529845 RepID=UPI00103CDBC7|nr:glycosyltransferase family 1 protein [Acinetobacter sp. ANC 4633]TCB27196.1 glycosyltransferase family 1 protein [Acinetobacter sp. ANC 4633]
MRIVVDVQCAQSKASGKRGVGRYVVEIVKALAKINQGKHELILLANASLGASKVEVYDIFGGVIEPENIKFWLHYFKDVSGISGDSGNRATAELIREWCIDELSPDILWIPNFQEGWQENAVTSIGKYCNNVIICTTLHDVIPLIYEDKYLISFIRDWYLDKINQTKQSDLILTVSDFSKKEINKRLHINSDTILVAPNSYRKDVFFQKNCLVKDIVPELNNNSFLLYVGGADDHKNLHSLIQAYSKLDSSLQNSYPLVMVGKEVKQAEQHLRTISKEYLIPKQALIFLGYIADEDLSVLYNTCTSFVFPSYSEGFGLPPLEAMACGAPVLAANSSSLPEVVGCEDALFDPFNIDELAKKISKIITDESYRKLLIKFQNEQLNKFSWDKSAQIILEKFEDIYLSKIFKKTELNQSDLIIKKVGELVKEYSFKEKEIKLISKSIAANYLSDEKKIYIDISCLIHFDHATGIQRVVRAILHELSTNEFEGYTVTPIFSYAGHHHFYHSLNKDGRFYPVEDSALTDSIVHFFPGDHILIIDLHPGSFISKKAILNELQIRGVVIGVVVYDLLPVQFPEFFVPALSSEFVEWLKVVALADYALCISKDVANKLQDWIKKNVTVSNKFLKIRHFYLGADIDNSIPSRGLPDNSNYVLETIKKSKSFLMVGTVEPRKGHGLVLDAFEKFWSQSESDKVLVIVGKEGWRNKQVINRIKSHKELGKKLFWLQGISDEYLDLVYNSSSCLIAASLGEGFGLPIIEASKHNIPIIARDIPVFREVAGEHAAYFNCNDDIELATFIDNWIELFSQDQYPKSCSINTLTWKQSAYQLLIAFDLI